MAASRLRCTGQIAISKLPVAYNIKVEGKKKEKESGRERKKERKKRKREKKERGKLQEKEND
jgi:hypothetical protein